MLTLDNAIDYAVISTVATTVIVSPVSSTITPVATIIIAVMAVTIIGPVIDAGGSVTIASVSAIIDATTEYAYGYEA